MEDEKTPTPEPEETEAKQGTPEQDDSLKDKHGEDAINRGRYERDMKAKEDAIAELKKQLEEATGKAKTGEDALA